MNPNSKAGNEIERTGRESIVGRARHSVRAALATSRCKISPASPYGSFGLGHAFVIRHSSLDLSQAPFRWLEAH